MMRVFLLLACLLWPVAAVACPAPPPPAATRSIPDPARPDQSVLADAVLSQVNALRCASGLRSLLAEPGLVAVAARHSQWQARRQVLSHRSDVPGLATLGDRLAAGGGAFGAGAENVGYVGGCDRSYLQIAHAMVGHWRNSASHRGNMLNGAFLRAGAGVAFAGGCSRAYLTLNLAD